MKNHIIPTLVTIAVLFSSCYKDKDYKCACTYVANSPGGNAGKPNIEEENIVTGKQKEQADLNCRVLETKYFSQDYSGTCLLR